jgi:hypothetical protein
MPSNINECTHCAHKHPETRMDSDFYIQSIMGATDRRRDGGTMAVVAGMVEGVLMLEGVVAWEQAMNTVENAPS